MNAKLLSLLRRKTTNNGQEIKVSHQTPHARQGNVSTNGERYKPQPIAPNFSYPQERPHMLNRGDSKSRFWVTICVTSSLFSVSGCAGPEPFYVKDGVTWSQYQRDTVSCQTQAAQAVPANTQFGWQPYVGIYSADTNSDLRNSNTQICLQDKGYRRVSIPLCDASIRFTALDGSLPDTDPNKRMKLGPSACYFIGPDMKPVFHTPS